MPIDVDQIDFDPTLPGFDEGESFAYDVLDRLGLRGHWCVWHLTNSHGFFNKHRIRLWIRLARAATAAEMKAYAKDRWGSETVEVDGKEKPIVDLAVYQPQQPIYTGDPILIDVQDPTTRRVGYIAGRRLEFKVAKRRRRESSESDDGNVDLLREHGLYIRRLKPGQHCVRCPWEESHSGEERADDTFYFEPHFNGHDIPAFKCHHGSCEDRKWTDVLEFMGVPVPAHVRQTESSFSKVDDDDDVDEPQWVWVHRRERFWDSRDGTLVKREVYDATHGGRGKKGTPTEQFLAAKRSLKCDEIEFLPGKGRIFGRGRLRVLNAYVDQRVRPDRSSDASPWIDHLRWLIPDEQDCERLMDWLAWAYQHPEQKIVWGPILYGPPGTGKTSVFDALAECIGRAHVSEPTQAELEDKFNDWAFGKLLVKIEELMAGDRYHVAEKLKPVVANPTLSIRAMYQTGFSVPNMANVCASTNHMQALPIEKGDRRWMLIQCREAAPGERRDHMRKFHEWLGAAGHGGIAHWLASRNLDHFNPKNEAPMTKLKRVVVEASKTDLDRAVDLCEGFDALSWVSSGIVGEYLDLNGSQVKDRHFGLIAARRGWKSLPSNSSRASVGGRRLTFWSPSGELGALRKFLALPHRKRDRLHSELAAKRVFTAEETQ